MSAYGITDALVAELNKKKFDFICLNYANGDMVGHTGVYEAIVKAVKTVDECVGKAVEAAVANDYEVIIIADHGNADNALNPDGSPNTAHSLNPVPFIRYPTSGCFGGKWHLADVAPSICQIWIYPTERNDGEKLLKI